MMFLQKDKVFFSDKNYNGAHNILRLFDILPYFISPKSETRSDNKDSNKNGICKLANKLPNDIRFVSNILSVIVASSINKKIVNAPVISSVTSNPINLDFFELV